MARRNQDICNVNLPPARERQSYVPGMGIVPVGRPRPKSIVTVSSLLSRNKSNTRDRSVLLAAHPIPRPQQQNQQQQTKQQLRRNLPLRTRSAPLRRSRSSGSSFSMQSIEESNCSSSSSVCDVFSVCKQELQTAEKEEEEETKTIHNSNITRFRTATSPSPKSSAMIQKIKVEAEAKVGVETEQETTPLPLSKSSTPSPQTTSTTADSPSSHSPQAAKQTDCFVPKNDLESNKDYLAGIGTVPVNKNKNGSSTTNKVPVRMVDISILQRSSSHNNKRRAVKSAWMEPVAEETTAAQYFF